MKIKFSLLFKFLVITGISALLCLYLLDLDLKEIILMYNLIDSYIYLNQIIVDQSKDLSLFCEKDSNKSLYSSLALFCFTTFIFLFLYSAGIPQVPVPIGRLTLITKKKWYAPSPQKLGECPKPLEIKEQLTEVVNVPEVVNLPDAAFTLYELVPKDGIIAFLLESYMG